MGKASNRLAATAVERIRLSLFLSPHRIRPLPASHPARPRSSLLTTYPRIYSTTMGQAASFVNAQLEQQNAEKKKNMDDALQGLKAIADAKIALFYEKIE